MYGSRAQPLTRSGTDRQDPADLPKDITELLHAWAGGNAGALEELLPLVYADLRRRAGAYMRKERRNHTLEPTALVHEAYLKLVDQRRATWQSRGQFFGVASQMMRRILVDHARRGRMAKRSGQWMRVTLDEGLVEVRPPDIDVIMLDDALTNLAAFDERKSRIAELRFFCGSSLEEMAQVLDISVATVERDWQTQETDDKGVNPCRRRASASFFRPRTCSPAIPGPNDCPSCSCSCRSPRCSCC